MYIEICFVIPPECFMKHMILRPGLSVGLECRLVMTVK